MGGTRRGEPCEGGRNSIAADCARQVRHAAISYPAIRAGRISRVGACRVRSKLESATNRRGIDPSTNRTRAVPAPDPVAAADATQPTPLCAIARACRTPAHEQFHPHEADQQERHQRQDQHERPRTRVVTWHRPPHRCLTARPVHRRSLSLRSALRDPSPARQTGVSHRLRPDRLARSRSDPADRAAGWKRSRGCRTAAPILSARDRPSPRTCQRPTHRRWRPDRTRWKSCTGRRSDRAGWDTAVRCARAERCPS